MAEARRTNGASIDKIGKLYNKARENYIGLYVYTDKDDEESRTLEAFLMLAILMERVLILFGLSSLGKRKNLSELYKKRKEPGSRYGIDNAINDVYLLGEVSTEEFIRLKKFQRDRNDYIHNIFTNKDDEIEEIAHNLFQEHHSIFILMLEKLKESSSA